MASIRKYLSVMGLFAAALVAPHVAHATGESCTNDIQCTNGGIACGSEICDWNQNMTCQPATGVASSGWCTVDSDCKCKGEGATCVPPYCTKTVGAAGILGGSAGSGAGGGSSAGGSTASTGGSTASTGGSTASTGGSTASTGGSAGPSTSAGSSSTPAASSDSGGCSLSGGAPRGSVGFALGAVCAAALIGARRRKRAA